jgi:hypothetical protein
VTLTSSIRLAVAAKLTNPLDLGVATAPVGLDLAVALADGTGVGQANRIFADTRTLAASATEDLDLSGALLDGLGGPAAFARVKAIVVHADEDNTNNVLVGRATSNGLVTMLGATAAVILRPGAFFAVVCGDEDAAGYAVTAGTGDLLTVANSGAGTAVSYDIVVIGGSA